VSNMGVWQVRRVLGRCENLNKQRGHF
jgi:hypothetical protein